MAHSKRGALQPQVISRVQASILFCHGEFPLLHTDVTGPVFTNSQAKAEPIFVTTELSYKVAYNYGRSPILPQALVQATPATAASSGSLK